MSSPLISLRQIEKSYPLAGGRVWVLRNIDLDIQAGEFVTMMGPSGAGKSTLLSVMGMLDAEWKGEYFLDGHAVHGMKLKERGELSRRTIGFVFQQYHLLDNLTVAENLEVPLSYRDLKRGEREALVGDMLDRFQLVGKKDLFPSQLSGGQQQLVGIARALIASPKVLLADEPTGNLHSQQAKNIMEVFQTLNKQGTTIIQVTHSEANAAYGNRIIQLADGWLQK
ncbi:ABC transporter ATP-binding protein [Myxococcus stipitatus DSM 14675]|uniref:ABC transporter ATP-binding protein n=1 Tax=Myxococcus stipitatus (strain DSM 14675 / JCM 12634 / Mx s8) TaxID=1278073 RepID=L7UR17_MYXSD|nr:ABC transporter ATP-binding protein [Myxococcus stipitatus]AGC49009.1 ABC transporter ATP-binding protein [Myxococcus stipitatus DSM 14675]